MLARLVLPAFVGWTLFVWGGRLRNLAADPGGLAQAGRWSLLGSIAFVALAVAVAVTRLGARVRPGRGPVAQAVLAALAALTVGVWVIRGVDIAAGDHSVGFIVVHLVLAVVSISLAMLSWRGSRASSGPRG